MVVYFPDLALSFAWSDTSWGVLLIECCSNGPLSICTAQYKASYFFCPSRDHPQPPPCSSMHVIEEQHSKNAPFAASGTSTTSSSLFVEEVQQVHCRRTIARICRKTTVSKQIGLSMEQFIGSWYNILLLARLDNKQWRTTRTQTGAASWQFECLALVVLLTSTCCAAATRRQYNTVSLKIETRLLKRKQQTC